METHYPWTRSPLVISAPTRPFATSALASAVSLSGGLGFLSYIPDSDLASPNSPSPPPSGTTHDLAACRDILSAHPSTPTTLPIGIGYIIHSAPLAVARLQISTYRPAAVWLFAPTAHAASHPDGTLASWAAMVRTCSPQTRIWVQVGSVAGALAALEEAGRDITLVVQGSDAGGHGLLAGAGLTTLFPEVADAVAERGYADVQLVAAGGITEARGASAATALGAQAVVLGTRFLASEEVAVPEGFRESVLAASDGGQSTFRTDVFDRLRGTKLGGEDGRGWPETYGARGLKNESSEELLGGGSAFEEVKRKFDEAQEQGRPERFGVKGRDVTYVGTGVGLIRGVMPAKEIVEELREGMKRILGGAGQRASEWN